MTGTADRLPRLLALVPYLQARPGVRVAEAAADWEVTEAQLRRDLELLWMCGLPGHGPGDLIDLSFEGDTVTVTFDAGMHRPLRLTADEALSLAVALRTLAGVPGLADRDVVERTLVKVEAAAGAAAEGAAAVTVALERRERESRGDGEDTAALIRASLNDHRALHLTYYAAGRDEITERVVDPMRLLLVDGRSYLEAWCRVAEDVRLFRLDRVDAARVLDEASSPPARAIPRDVTGGVFRPAPEHDTVRLSLGPGARWVADYYPCEEIAEAGDRLEIVLRVADRRWVRRLVLGLGAEADVIEPSSLAADIRAEASAALAAYEQLSSSP